MSRPLDQITVQLVERLLRRSNKLEHLVHRFNRWYDGVAKVFVCIVPDAKLDEAVMRFELAGVDYLTVRTPGRPAVLLSEEIAPEEAAQLAIEGTEPGPMFGGLVISMTLALLDEGASVRVSEQWGRTE